MEKNYDSLIPPEAARRLLGCTQEEMHLFLRISRSTLTRVESGAIDLPEKARNLYLEMLRWIERSKAKMEESGWRRQVPASRLISILHKKKARQVRHLNRCKKSLADLEERFRIGEQREGILRGMVVTTEGRYRTNHERWLRALQRRQEMRFKYCDYDELLMTRIRIAGIEAEIAAVEGEMKRLG